MPVSSISSRFLLATSLFFSALWIWERAQRAREREIARVLRDKLGQDLVKVIRNQRHGFMNHLQVISGWLQLKKPDHVLDYIDGIRRKREQESQILRVRNVEMLGLLLVKSALAEANELDIRWEVEGALVEPPAFWVEAIGIALEQLISTLARLGGEPELTVRLIESDTEMRAVLLTSGMLGTEQRESELAGFAELAAKIRAAGGRWVEELSPVYAIEVSVPTKPAVFRHTRTG